MTRYADVGPFFISLVVNLILIGTPISVSIAITLRLTRAASPRARYLLTVTAFLAAAVLPFVVTLTPAQETSHLPTVLTDSSIDSADIPTEPLTGNIYLQRLTMDVPQGDSRPATSVNPLDSLVRFLSKTPLSIGLFSLWLVGACVLLGRETVGHLRVARARHQWTPANQNIRERLAWPKGKPLYVDNQCGPCALGVFRPTVVIPTHLIDVLSPNAACQIARHELNHLRWRDPFINVLMRIVRASLWPSVPLWYLDRAARLEREVAADRAAVHSISGGLRQDVAAVEYASALVLIARRFARGSAGRQYDLVATEIGSESGLDDRVRRLMAISSRPTNIRLCMACVTLLASASWIAVFPVAKLEAPNSHAKGDQEKPQPETTFNNLPFTVGRKKRNKNERAVVSSPGNALRNNEQHRPRTTNGDRMEPATLGENKGLAGAIAVSAATHNTLTSPPTPANLWAQDFQSQMAALGYEDLSPEQLAKMRANAVSPAYVREMADLGYGGLPADMLIKFKWLAVSGSYIREMKDLGYDKLSARTLAGFREYGVSSHYIREMRSRVLGPITGEQLVNLRFYGASTEFVDKLKALGYERLNADLLISMRLQGVTIAYIEEKTRGRIGLSAGDLIGMRMRGTN